MKTNWCCKVRRETQERSVVSWRQRKIRHVVTSWTFVTGPQSLLTWVIGMLSGSPVANKVKFPHCSRVPSLWGTSVNSVSSNVFSLESLSPWLSTASKNSSSSLEDVLKSDSESIRFASGLTRPSEVLRVVFSRLLWDFRTLPSGAMLLLLSFRVLVNLLRSMQQFNIWKTSTAHLVHKVRHPKVPLLILLIKPRVYSHLVGKLINN